MNQEEEALRARAVAETLPSGDDRRRSDGPRAALADTTAGGGELFAAHLPDGAAAPRGRYVILARLGAGAMGEVFSGYDHELDRRVALKLLRALRSDDPTSRARMQREAQALARLSHPNVVQVHDVGELGGQLFVAMEYVKGETLGDWQARHDPATPAGRRAIVDAYVQAGRGLAAAHAAGIVHRDFKPSNALVGDDGRTRVLDFGLAAASSGRSTRAEDEVAITAAGEVSGPIPDDLTRTGTLLGTPAYMAPEQFLDATVDHRTDIFAFSVALYEALYGESPFDGETVATRRRSVLACELRPASAASRVPAWLRAVLERGLARDPARRHPTIEAMLTALQDDPDERRRRGWRQVRLVLAVAAIASLLLIAGSWVWDRWQLAAAEERAARRLRAVEARVSEAEAIGQHAEAEQAFMAFVAHPDNRGSVVLGSAWLHRAEDARARGDGAGAVDAYAGAYVVATAAVDRRAARLGLARIFRDELRWRGLSLALAGLDADEDEALAPGELGELRLDAALARRDLATAALLLRGPLASSPKAELLPVITALQRVTPTVHRHRGNAVIADLDGDGRRELLLETDARHRQLVPLLRAEPSLPQIATLDLEATRFRALSPGPGQPALIVGTEQARSGTERNHDAVVRRWRHGQLVEEFRWADDGLIGAVAADVDGDGQVEFLLGTGPYTRHVVELSRGADGTWSTRAPAPDLDRRRSDVVALLAEDLDGDGTVEVAAALGPWQAYEVVLLRHDAASDTLRTFTRRRFGNLTGAATLRRGGPGDAPEIVVTKTDEYRNPEVFPADLPHGEPAGVHLLRLRDDRLEPTAFLPTPTPSADGWVTLGRPLVGDLDGDGRDELIVGCSIADTPMTGERDTTTIHVSARDGTLLPIFLDGLRPIAVLDLDGDGDAELIVSDSLAADQDRVWVLGSGDAALPITVASPPVPDAATPQDPVLATLWRHADELAQMGLARQAAESLARLADLTPEPVLRGQATLRAGAMFEAFAADARAAELFARAAMEPTVAGRAHLEAARTLLRRGRVDAAATHLTATTADAPFAAGLRAALAALQGEPGVDLDFTTPLADSWRIADPLALRRNGALASLHVDAVGVRPLMSAPARWSGGAVVLAIDIDLKQSEWSSGLQIGLVRDGDDLNGASSPIGIHLTTTGGGKERTHEIACLSYGRRSVARIPFEIGDPSQRLGRFSVRATLLPELGEWTCEVVRAGQPLYYGRVTASTEARETGPLRLAVLASGPSRVGWTEVELHRMTLIGAGLAGPDSDPTSDPGLIAARRALVEDDGLSALTAFAGVAAPSPVERLIPVLALTRMGRPLEAQQVLAQLIADPTPAPTMPLEIAARVRVEPEIFGPVLRGATNAAMLRTYIGDALLWAVYSERDPRAFVTAWLGLADRDLDTDRCNVLRVHALSAAALGHLESARASHRARLTALLDPARCPGVDAPGARAQEEMGIRFQLAALALRAGDEAAARAELAPYVRSAEVDPDFADRLRAREDLRALWDLAPG
jgi:tRNA A-37 threonylcarbamoyl transferase component Bud32